MDTPKEDNSTVTSPQAQGASNSQATAHSQNIGQPIANLGRCLYAP